MYPEVDGVDCAHVCGWARPCCWAAPWPDLATVLNDVTTTALHSALRGLSLRQRTIADNVANIETPQFLANKVDFETNLRSAVADGKPESAQAVTVPSGEPTRLNGNNVNLDQESLDLIETGLRYQLTVQAMTSKFSLLRTAIGGR